MSNWFRRKSVPSTACTCTLFRFLCMCILDQDMRTGTWRSNGSCNSSGELICEGYPEGRLAHIGFEVQGLRGCHVNNCRATGSPRFLQSTWR